jgi:hypothetical protein
MSAVPVLQHEVAWTSAAGAAVQKVVMAAAAGWTVVADAERNISVLDEQGTAKGSFRVSQPVKALRADCRGNLFAALAGQVIYAFDASAQLEWRLDLQGDLTGFDLHPSGDFLAAVTAEGNLHVYNPRTRERWVASTKWPLTGVAIGSSGKLQAVVCDRQGRLALLDFKGTAEWQEEVGEDILGVSISAVSDLIAVPVRGRKLLLFRLNGQKAGAIELDEAPGDAAVAADGSAIMVQLGSRLLLVGADSAVRWERSLDPAVVAWSLGMGGRMVAVAQGGPRVTVLRFKAPEPAAKPTAARRKPQPAPEAPPEREYLEVEKAVAGAEPQQAPSASPRLAWKKDLPGELLPTDRTRFCISRDGEYVVLVLGDGTVTALDRQGEARVRASTAMPARLAPHALNRAFSVWSEGQWVKVDLTVGTITMTPFGPEPVRHFDCSTDCSFVCAVDAASTLRTYRSSATASWQRTLKTQAAGLFVSPQGKVVLVPDDEGRHRYYNAAGTLLRKFRFGEAQGRRAMALSDGFSVFGSEDGMLTVLDGDCQELWSERLFPRASDLELFGLALTVYGEGGRCACIDPLEHVGWTFEPPPGQCRLRKDPAGQPLIIHVAGAVVTAFTGYGSDLKAVWRFECEDGISLFDVDQKCKTIVALAGSRLYRLELPDGS